MVEAHEYETIMIFIANCQQHRWSHALYGVQRTENGEQR